MDGRGDGNNGSATSTVVGSRWDGKMWSKLSPGDVCVLVEQGGLEQSIRVYKSLDISEGVRE